MTFVYVFKINGAVTTRQHFMQTRRRFGGTINRTVASNVITINLVTHNPNIR